MKDFPVIQILLLVGAVLGVSAASILTEGAMLPALLVGLAVLAIIALGVIDRHRETRLFPRGTFSTNSGLGALFAAMLLLNMAIVSDMFVPLFVQQLHGQTPLIAGYMVALVAVGWSGGSIVTSGWTRDRARLALMAGPVLQVVGTIGLALFIGGDNTGGRLLPLLPIGVSLVLLGTRHRHRLAAGLGAPAAIRAPPASVTSPRRRCRWCSCLRRASAPPSRG